MKNHELFYASSAYPLNWVPTLAGPLSRIPPSMGKRPCDKWVGTAAHPCWSYARLILSSGRSRPQLLNSRYTVSQAHTRTATTDRCTSTTLGQRRTELTSTT